MWERKVIVMSNDEMSSWHLLSVQFPFSLVQSELALVATSVWHIMLLYKKIVKNRRPVDATMQNVSLHKELEYERSLSLFDKCLVSYACVMAYLRDNNDHTITVLLVLTCVHPVVLAIQWQRVTQLGVLYYLCTIIHDSVSGALHIFQDSISDVIHGPVVICTLIRRPPGGVREARGWNEENEKCYEFSIH